MAAIPYWAADGIEASAWNVVWIGPFYLPGICRVEVDKGRDVDVQKSPGVDGARIKDKGIVPAKVTIEFTPYNNPEAWAMTCEILPQLDPHRPGAVRHPYTILNPEPNHLGVNQIEILRIKSKSPDCRSGKKYTFECQQWFPEVKTANAKTTVGKKGGTQTPPIMVPTIGLNGVQNFVERDQTVKNWVDADPETGMVPDIPDFGVNST